MLVPLLHVSVGIAGYNKVKSFHQLSWMGGVVVTMGTCGGQ